MVSYDRIMSYLTMVDHHGCGVTHRPAGRRLWLWTAVQAQAEAMAEKLKEVPDVE